MTSKRQVLKEFIRKTLIINLILGIIAFLSPSFTVSSIWILLVCGGLISTLDFLLQNYTNIKYILIGRGLVGFFVSFIVLLMSVNTMAGFNMSVMTIVIISILIALIDIIIPGIEL